MGKTNIAWTEMVWNPVRGCTPVSSGCTHCYAKRFAERFRGVNGHPFEQGFDVRLVPEALDLPLHWRKPRRIFVNSMSDLFHPAVPDEFIERVFAVMLICVRRENAHTFQVLTKRAERMRKFFEPYDERLLRIARAAGSMMEDGDSWHDEVLYGNRGVLSHPRIWLGVSCEDQAAADDRIPELLATPAAVRFLSCEPLLGPVNLSNYLEGWEEGRSKKIRQGESLAGGNVAEPQPSRQDPAHLGTRPSISWCIVGGESGPGARPMHPQWARSIRDQCQAAGVSFFFKQWGEWLPVAAPHTNAPNGRRILLHENGTQRECSFSDALASAGPWQAFERWGKARAGRLLDGREWNETPTRSET